MPSYAEHSIAEQLCRGIMHGENSRIQAVPALEISAEQVTCTHGVAISDLDENSLFFLASRGIDRPVNFYLSVFMFFIDDVLLWCRLAEHC